MRQRRGFTLVELSIVLVVIGLLIGGILAAQSMISTSKISAQVRQIGQFDAMVMNFKTKFNALPGDAMAFGGNGDGAISGCPVPGWCPIGAAQPTAYFKGEIANFFNNINPQFMADTGSAAITQGALKNVPEAKMGGNGAFFIASAMSAAVGDPPTDYGVADLDNIQNYYAMMSSYQAQKQRGGVYIFNLTATGGGDNASAAKAIDLLALDAKMDDGIGNTGNVISGKIGNWGGTGAGGIYSTPLATCSDSITGVYDLTHNTDECTPLIRIGSTTGDPQ